MLPCSVTRLFNFVIQKIVLFLFLHYLQGMHQLNKLKFISEIQIFVFFLLFFVPNNTYTQERIKNVVIFFSYGSNLPAFENILTGLKSTIGGSNDETVNIMTEYLDFTRLKNDDYARIIIDMYNNKVKDFKIDLLITVGPGVNDALVKYGDSTLINLNNINIDLDIPGRKSLRDLNIRNGKEILLKFQVEKTLKEAFNLFPEYKTVYVISGVSPVDFYYTSLVQKSITEFEHNYTFKFISDMSLDSTVRFVRTIPANSIVIVPAYLKDAANIPYTTPEALTLISKNSSAPVFLTITDAGVKTQGSIGGYLFSYTKLGNETGRIAREILNGKRIQEIPLNETSFYEHIYDWNELKKWNLTNSKAIPNNSIFYNKDTSFLEIYKWYLLAVLMFLILQTMLIIFLIRLNKRQKYLSSKMEETESMHRELIHTDRLSKMSTLTASLSHELFQPLAAIRLTAQAGKRFIQTDKLDMNKASQMFENILEDDIRATRIISSVKSLMKPETAEKENVNLNILINETAELVRSEAKKAGIKIEIGFEADPVFVFGDKIQLQQVLMNFIKNAMTAMEKNNPEDRLLEINLKLTSDEVIVSVQDSGPGIDAKVRENLFKPFVSTKKEGFGIGLTLCKSLIEKHNGKIWAENISEGGTVFSFSLNVIKKV